MLLHVVMLQGICFAVESILPWCAQHLAFAFRAVAEVS